jgi:hypothetical protein
MARLLPIWLGFSHFIKLFGLRVVRRVLEHSLKVLKRLVQVVLIVKADAAHVDRIRVGLVEQHNRAFKIRSAIKPHDFERFFQFMLGFFLTLLFPVILDSDRGTRATRLLSI